jgi:hypothetical protein
MPLSEIDRQWKYGKDKTIRAIILGGMVGMDRWAKLVATRAKTGPDLPVKSGHLGRNIRAGKVTVFPIARYTALVGTGSEVPYARAQEMGSGLFAEFGPKQKIRIWAGKLNPGQTKSLNPKWSLSFKWKGGPSPHPALTTEGQYAGHYTFAYVDHPGVRPRKFLRNAAEKSAEEGRRAVLSALNAALEARSGSSR